VLNASRITGVPANPVAIRPLDARTSPASRAVPRSRLVVRPEVEGGRQGVGGLRVKPATVQALAFPARLSLLPRHRLLQPGWVAGASTLGAASVYVILKLYTGRWNAHLLSMQKYGVAVQSPVTNFQNILQGRHFTVHPSFIPPDQVNQVQTTISAELIYHTALALLGLSALAVARAKATATPLDWAMALYGVLMLVAPLSISANVAQFRSHTLMLPLVVALRRLPAPVTLGAAIAGAALAPTMSEYFFLKILI
jgi:hypothetical protein